MYRHFTFPHDGAETPPGPTPGTSQRGVLVVGDAETASMQEDLATAAARHSVRVDQALFFDREDLDSLNHPMEHPALVLALTNAAKAHLGIWLPFPVDLGHEVSFLGFVSVAAHLGIPVFTGRCLTSWTDHLLPGLSTTDTLAICAQTWRRFLAEVGGELLVTSLCLALAQPEEAA